MSTGLLMKVMPNMRYRGVVLLCIRKRTLVLVFTDESFTTERSIKLGDLIPQQELVWKANWIDATHSRNILCNRLWEEMVQSRKGFPKREVDRAYLNQLGVNSLDTGAIGHVDGYPAVVRLNGVFMG